MQRTFFFPLIILFCTLVSLPARADAGFAARPDVRQFIGEMVRTHGFDNAALTQTMASVVTQPQIIESMEKPYEKKTWDIYQQLFLTPERLEGGLAFWKANQNTLKKAEKEFGVPASIIVAIIGVETRYGQNQGSYRVLDALATLAFDYPKRAPFFRKELAEYLQLCREQKVAPGDYLGSYAGAIGKPQFMPSSYRAFAVDYSGTGKKDLRNDDADVIASIGNYLQKHGWKRGEAIAQPARIRGSAYKRVATNTRTAEYSTKALARLGIRPTTPPWRHPEKAGLIELLTSSGEEYWVGFPNFYVITRYNSSPQYALVVYLLSKQLEDGQKRLYG
ncbi:lytic murein transglycosylase B [Legionella geestiana]|uniref:lytic murein transglycosylase B n=1 Tax=Legionella geestiana TaxID=45065 RepID=UPI00109332C0|nr:lytic murein transglycosylase B [Legionella geestiana]QDQ39095.1 lytic murein transglycosylase B [Legionella geestiana]